jgi:hypothetical protein
MKLNRYSSSRRCCFRDCVVAGCIVLYLGCGQSTDSSCDKTRDGAFRSDSRDSSSGLLPEPAQWIDAGLVIDTGTFGSWDTVMEGITPSAVVRRNGTFFLYYVGADDYIADLNNIGPAHRSIGVAVSQDGIHWTKPPTNPVINYSASGNPEEGAVSAGMTTDQDGTLLAYYGANIGPNATASMVNADVRLATSSDGLLFEQVDRVIDHRDPRVWGHGDEIHATLALRHDGMYYVYYVPNGTRQAGFLGYCRGSTRATLLDCGPVMSGSSPVRSAGPSSVTRIGPNTFAFFVSDRGTVNVYEVEANCLTSFGSPSRTYPVGSGAVFAFDRDRRTWFMYFSKWTHIELRVAPAGSPDTTPPSAPLIVTGNSPRYDLAQLQWSEASDPDTGILSYNVYRDGKKIGSTLALSYRDSLLAEHTTYDFAVRAVNLHGLEGPGRTLTFRTPADTIPPAIQAVSAPGAGNILVAFDEPVARAVGPPATSFAISGDIDVTAVSAGNDARTVVISTTGMQGEATYTLTVTGILDRANTPNTGTGERTFTASPAGGLIGRWSMDEPESPGIDTSGSAHHATVFGGAELSRGQQLTGLELTGGEYLEIAPTPALEEAFRTGCTIAAWVRPADLPPGTDTTNGAYAIFSGPGGLQLQYRSDGRFAAVVGNSRETVELTSDEFVPGTWHHVVMGLDAIRNSLSLYVDGDPVEGSPLGSPGVRIQQSWRSPNYVDYHGRYRIGVNNPRFKLDSNYFRGTLDEVRFYRRAMTESEIRRLPWPPAASRDPSSPSRH